MDRDFEVLLLDYTKGIGHIQLDAATASWRVGRQAAGPKRYLAQAG
jgi:hypothetical protein